MGGKHGVFVGILIAVCAGGLLLLNDATSGSRARAQVTRASDAPDPKDLDFSRSELRPFIERYVSDRGSMARSYPIEVSPSRQARFRKLYADWLATLSALNFDALSQDGKVDYLLLKSHLEHEMMQLDLQTRAFAEVEQLAPFSQTITDLAEARRRMEKIDPAKTAATLNQLVKRMEATRRSVEGGLRAGPGSIKKTVANRAVNNLTALRGTLRAWYGYYSGYDPMFTWWVEEPYKAVDQTLAGYISFLSERVAGIRRADPAVASTGGPGGGRGPGGGQGGAGEGQRAGFGGGPTARPGDTSDIVGDPIGRDGLMADLAAEMIPYTPEELIAIGYKELDWCENEMKKASRELGYGDDWRKALEHVKNLYVEPGKQPEMIRDLAYEAIEYVERNNLVTIPPLARESWRMEMMSPERQLVSPFFLGGEVILVSYPTNTMSHEQKMMSMRGNNPHFSRATVHHELIPGHHLQGFMTARYKSYRALFNTPFWTEGWSLYWELLLWDMKFPKTPEDRIGFLFWRSHRCARIIFSLSFHLEKMTPQECIDLLVNRVGHEVDNATAEVRRSFNGTYSPLYQAGYLLGGLQIYSLHRELVDSGKMTNRAFHDAILRENRIPIEMLRALMTGKKLNRDYRTEWKFYGPPPPAR